MVRYLTRIEVGARYDLKDKRGRLAGEYFWDSVGQDTGDEIVAILVAAGWPDPPPSPLNGGCGGGGGKGVGGLILRGRSSRGGGGGGGRNWSSAPPAKNQRGGGRGSDEGGEVGMKRLASDMKSLMKRR